MKKEIKVSMKGFMIAIPRTGKDEECGCQRKGDHPSLGRRDKTMSLERYLDVPTFSLGAIKEVADFLIKHFDLVCSMS